MPDTRGLVKLDEKAWYARHLIFNVLDVDVPMISAVNGPCNMHSEVPLMGDIVLASEDAYFQDASHFPRGQVPGDGQHVIWSFLAGHTRARYFLLTGKKLARRKPRNGASSTKYCRRTNCWIGPGNWHANWSSGHR